MRIAINVAAFYAAWFAAVLAAAKGWPWAAVGVCLAVAALHLMLSARRGVEIGLMIASALAGFGVETLLMQAGLATYASSGPLDGFAPIWLVALWMACATLFNISLAWLKPRLWLAIVLAFAGGPASYFAGAKLGGMELAEPVWVSLAAIGVLWAIAFPILLIIARLSDPEPSDASVKTTGSAPTAGRSTSAGSPASRASTSGR